MIYNDVYYLFKAANVPARPFATVTEVRLPLSWVTFADALAKIYPVARCQPCFDVLVSNITIEI